MRTRIAVGPYLHPASTSELRSNQLAFAELVTPDDWSEVTLNEFQRLAVSTAINPDGPDTHRPMFAGIEEELGEVAEKLEDAGERDFMQLSTQERDALVLEVGDVMWFASDAARQLSWTLGDLTWYESQRYMKGNYGSEFWEAANSRLPEHLTIDEGVDADIRANDYQALQLHTMLATMYHSPAEMKSYLNDIVLSRFSEDSENTFLYFEDRITDAMSAMSAVAINLGIPMSEVLRRNRKKLLDRLERDVIMGEGDYR